MLEAHVKIDKELAVKGFRRAKRYSAFHEIALFYGYRLAAVWIVISIADAVIGAPNLMTFHLVVLGIVWLAATVHRYAQGYKEVAQQTVGWEFYAKLDDIGVTTDAEQVPNIQDFYPWSHYTGYREYDDYLEITDINGQTSFLPKDPKLYEIIAFTKRKIPSGPELYAREF